MTYNLCTRALLTRFRCASLSILCVMDSCHIEIYVCAYIAWWNGIWWYPMPSRAAEIITYLIDIRRITNPSGCRCKVSMLNICHTIFIKLVAGLQRITLIFYIIYTGLYPQNYISILYPVITRRFKIPSNGGHSERLTGKYDIAFLAYSI